MKNWMISTDDFIFLMNLFSNIAIRISIKVPLLDKSTKICTKEVYSIFIDLAINPWINPAFGEFYDKIAKSIYKK